MHLAQSAKRCNSKLTRTQGKIEFISSCEPGVHLEIPQRNGTATIRYCHSMSDYIED